MRKYRAYNTKLKKMMPVLSIELNPEFGGVEVFKEWVTDYLTGERDERREFWTWDDCVLMQCIGRPDRNGHEIYEGDIVRINHPHDRTGDFTGTLGVVFWGDEEAAWYHGNQSGRPPKRMWEYAEVVGNVYENPEYGLEALDER